MSLYYIAFLTPCVTRNHVITIHQGTFVPKSTLGTRLCKTQHMIIHAPWPPADGEVYGIIQVTSVEL